MQGEHVAVAQRLRGRRDCKTFAVCRAAACKTVAICRTNAVRRIRTAVCKTFAVRRTAVCKTFAVCKTGAALGGYTIIIHPANT